jgi:hypothetical protein
LVSNNVAGRDKDGVGLDSLPSIWHPKRMVQRKRSFCVRKAVKIPVCLAELVSYNASSGLEELTCDDNMIGVFFVVAIATILKSQVMSPRV